MDPRHTAAAIARVRADEGRRPPAERLFDDPFASLFDDVSLDVRAVFELLPFFTEHLRLRTRFIDDCVRDGLANGIRHVVIVGAGFDTRALRMPEIREAGARVVEIDHADQLAEKQKRFEAAGVTLPDALSFAPADVSVDGALAEALRRAGVSSADGVLFICEGLFGYLSRDAITALAESTARSSGSGSRLVANHNTASWSSARLMDMFASSGWTASVGPAFRELHERFIGHDVPPGADDYALFVAQRA